VGSLPLRLTCVGRCARWLPPATGGRGGRGPAASGQAHVSVSARASEPGAAPVAPGSDRGYCLSSNECGRCEKRRIISSALGNGHPRCGSVAALNRPGGASLRGFDGLLPVPPTVARNQLSRGTVTAATRLTTCRRGYEQIELPGVGRHIFQEGATAKRKWPPSASFAPSQLALDGVRVVLFEADDDLIGNLARVHPRLAVVDNEFCAPTCRDRGRARGALDVRPEDELPGRVVADAEIEGPSAELFEVKVKLTASVGDEEGKSKFVTFQVWMGGPWV